MNGFKFNVQVTFSKAIGALIIIMAFLMDFLSDKNGTVFMYSIPFTVFLITGKQYFDAKKVDKGGKVNEG